MRVAAVLFALLGVSCVEHIEPSDSFLCGTTSTELFVKAGAAGLPPGPRRVTFVLERSMGDDQKAAWRDGVEAWRFAVEGACPFVPTFVEGSTSGDLSYTGDTGNSPARDVIELRVDDPQPDEKAGNGWSWPMCRSGRATVSASAKDAHRAVRHELGHALGGLPHDESGAPSIMSVDGPGWWRVEEVQPSDVAAYARLWCAVRRPD